MGRPAPWGFLMGGVVHVIGAGVAGLAAAVRLAKTGHTLTVYEQAGYAGGRCRSYFDEILGARIDNGNHLFLSGNTSIGAYLDLIGATDRLASPPSAAFPFYDRESGERWTVRPNRGRLPWWVFSPSRRVPGTGAMDYLIGFRNIMNAGERTVGACLNADAVLYRRFWGPLAVSILNTQPEEGAASLLAAVFQETVMLGEAASRPCIARTGLSDTFIDPAVEFLRDHDASVHFSAAVRELVFDGDRVSGVQVDGSVVPVGDDDQVIVAVPPHGAQELVPGLSVPLETRTIVNGHFKVSDVALEVTFLGVIGGTAEWIFVRNGIASVTVSAADDLAALPAERIAETLWADVAAALDINDPVLPSYRILKERRATFAQTPAQVKQRPGCQTDWNNLWLAGDWTDTGLPATVEGAIRSGFQAAGRVAG